MEMKTKWLTSEESQTVKTALMGRLKMMTSKMARTREHSDTTFIRKLSISLAINGSKNTKKCGTRVTDARPNEVMSSTTKGYLILKKLTCKQPPIFKFIFHLFRVDIELFNKKLTNIYVY